jgi:hypothetical protein
VTLLAARAAQEIGADLVTTCYAGDPEGFHKVVEGCFVPVVVLGGEKVETVKQVFSLVHVSIQAGGGKGIVIGRTIWEHGRTMAIVGIVHEGWTVKQALACVGQEPIGLSSAWKSPQARECFRGSIIQSGGLIGGSPAAGAPLLLGGASAERLLSEVGLWPKQNSGETRNVAGSHHVRTTGEHGPRNTHAATAATSCSSSRRAGRRRFQHYETAGITPKAHRTSGGSPNRLRC